MAFFVLAMLLPLALGGAWRRRLRVLVPSWRFFENIERGHELWILLDDGWVAPPLVANSLFLNPEGLLELACRDLVHAFTHELVAQEGDIARWNSYRLLQNLTRLRGGTRFKLKQNGQDVFLSGPC